MPKPLQDLFRQKTKPEVVMTAEQYSGTPPSEPEKAKIEVAPVTGDVKVLDVKPGEVGFLDKLKAYYHTVITVLGGIVVFVNEVTPLTDALGPDVQRWVSVVVIFLTALLNMLKSNEVWINKPPSAG